MQQPWLWNYQTAQTQTRVSEEVFASFGDLKFSTPPASKSPAPIMDLGAQDQQKNPKSEGLQWDLGILELDLRFRGGLGLSPIGLENFRGGLSPSPPLNLKSNSKILKPNWT